MSRVAGRDRRRWWGMRSRIAAAIAGIVLVAVAALGFAVHQLVVLNRVHEARDAADDRMRAAMQVYRGTQLLSFEARPGAGRVPAELRAQVDRDGARATLVRGGSTRDVWAAGRVGRTVLTTHEQIRSADASVRAVDQALLLAGIATVALTSILGFAIAGRLARRIRLAARTAQGVAAGGDPASLRAAVGQRRDEVGALADAVDAMAERLNQRLRQEQRFTADVAHDLRTPVTGLATAAALLDDSRPAQLVRDRVVALTALVEDLLEVSRLDRGAETADLEHVDLADALARAVRRGVRAGEYAAADVDLRTDDTPAVLLTDPRRLERVVSNLVRNARQHGRPPVEIWQVGHEVTVRDHGDGFDEAMLRGGPQRFRRGSGSRGGGSGLGLVIAAGQAEVIGARLELFNATDGGACVRLALPGHEKVTDRSRRPHRSGTVA